MSRAVERGGRGGEARVDRGQPGWCFARREGRGVVGCGGGGGGEERRRRRDRGHERGQVALLQAGDERALRRPGARRRRRSDEGEGVPGAREGHVRQAAALRLLAGARLGLRGLERGRRQRGEGARGPPGRVVADHQAGASGVGEEAQPAGVAARLGVEVDEHHHREVEPLAGVDGREAHGVVVRREHGGLRLVGVVAHAPLQPPHERRQRPSAPAGQRHEPVEVADARVRAGERREHAVQIERRRRRADGLAGRQAQGGAADLGEAGAEALEARALVGGKA